jgi:hypothetical protein
MADHISSRAVAGMVGLDGLMMLCMGLMLVCSLLLVVVQEGHPLTAGRAIETGVVALLVVLAVHAPQVFARGARDGGFGWGRRIGDEVVEQRVQKYPVCERGAGAGLRI